jgi:O-antigen ligase
LLYFVSIIYLSFAFVQLLQIDDFDKQTLYNITSLAAHKNLYSSFNILLIISISFLEINNHKKSPVSIIIISLLILTTLLIQTRSAILGIATGSLILCAYLIIRSQAKSRRIYLTVSSMLVLPLLGWFVMQTSFFEQHLNSDSSIERLLIWKKTLLLANENLLLGVGAGNWSLVFPSVGLPDIDRITNGNIIFQKVHNEFLQHYSEIGIIGLITYCSIFIIVIWGVISVLRKKLNAYSSIMFIGLISYLVIMFFDFPNSRIVHLAVLGLFMGWLCMWISKNKVSLKSVKINVPFVTVCILMITFSVMITFFRIQGELTMNQLLDERKSHNWTKVISLAKNSQNVFYNLDKTGIPIVWYSGMAKFHLGKSNEALLDFEKAYKLNPFNFHVLNNYALSISGRDLPFAQSLLERAVNINSYFDEGRSNLIKVLIKNGNLNLAETHVNKIKDVKLRLQLSQLVNKYKSLKR